MLGRIGRHVGRNVVAYIALFVALGGTGAYAAQTIGARDIRSGAVHTRQIARGGVHSSDVRDDSLRGRDIDESTLDGPAVAYAHVKADGSLDWSLSWKVVAVQPVPPSPTRSGAGTYCFDLRGGVSAENVVATGALAPGAPAPVDLVVALPSTNAPALSECPTGYRDAFVGTRGAEGPVDAPFFVVFH